MAFDRAKTSLGFLEERFRKYFGLAGNIGATFEATIAPTYVVGDARDPGVASFVGRHWAWVSQEFTAPSAGNDKTGLLFSVPVIVRGIGLLGSMATSSRLHALLLAPDDTAVASVFDANIRNGGTWIDQKRTDVDPVPFNERSAPVMKVVVIANPHLKLISSWSQGPAGATIPQAVHKIDMHVPAGGAIVWDANIAAASFVRVGLWGQIGSIAQ